MISTSLLIAVSFLLHVSAAPSFQAPPPAKGDNGKTGGIFDAGDSINITVFLSGKGGNPFRPGSPAPAASAPKQAPNKDSGTGWASMLDALTKRVGAVAKGGTCASLEVILGGVMGGRGAEAVTSGTLTPEQWAHPGTGPYPAHYLTINVESPCEIPFPNTSRHASAREDNICTKDPA